MKQAGAHAGGMGKRCLMAAGLLLLAAACGNKQPTVIDGSTPERFAETSAQARRDIPDADRLDYDAALKRPPGTRYGDTEVEMEARARETYNGMTASEVLETYGPVE